jgi:hypothetical protein
MNEEYRHHIKCLLENRKDFGGLCADGMIILKWNLTKSLWACELNLFGSGYIQYGTFERDKELGNCFSFENIFFFFELSPLFW